MTLKNVWDELTGSKVKEKPKGNENMLNHLKELFVKETSLMQTCKVSAMIINLLNELNAQTLKAIDTKNEAIDCIIQILESEKT